MNSGSTLYISFDNLSESMRIWNELELQFTIVSQTAAGDVVVSFRNESEKIAAQVVM